MPKTIKVLGLHGLGDHRASDWKERWTAAIQPAATDGVVFDFNYVTYDPLFEDTDISFGETMRALWKLGRSGVSNILRRERSLISDVSDRVRWTAGYVIAWVEDKEFQARTRELIYQHLVDYQPDVVLGHSLGSLISYNAFSHADAAKGKIAEALARVHYVTLGSQIGNPFVLGNLTNGRVQNLAVKHWHHLYNEHDDVFTAPLNIQGVPNFNQLLTPFDLEGRGDHSAEYYLGHVVTQGSIWRPLVKQATGAKAFSGDIDPWKRQPDTQRASRRRALLIGIDDYPNEADRLQGCVNDVFAMSAALQDCGFEPDEIRVCLNDRATADGIISRMKWLVDGAAKDDQLVFFYSGHGARVPEYGEFEEPDHMTETLVPYDFDWSPERSVSDEQIYQLYSQLPYDVQFLMIFDCCHSGSMHRQSAARARGINPPDDIRHRQLKWDREEEMWVERDFRKLNAQFTDSEDDRTAYFGADGSTVRIGRAAPLRLDDQETYERARKPQKSKKAAKSAGSDPIGPFLPLIIEACGEEQLSYEYRHGVTSYGAFTFCLTSILRQEPNLTFSKLVELARDRLTRLGYQQTPQILGPTALINAKVPLKTGRGRSRPSKGLPGSATPRTTG